MKQVILIHGLPDKEEVMGDVWPSPSNCHWFRHWFPWIQKQLARKDVVCQTPEMPHCYNPSYVDHCFVFDQANISSETVVVGHSCGGGFLLRYFSENRDKVPGKIVLVAPWVDPENYLQELNPDTDFFDFEIDTALTDRTEVHCIYSTDDADYNLRVNKKNSGETS